MTSPLSLSSQQQIDLLRAAAARIRELAALMSASGDTTWAQRRSLTMKSPLVTNHATEPTIVIETFAANFEQVNTYLTLWASPVVPLAVADLLDAIAVDHEAHHTMHAADLEQALILAQRIGGEQ